MRVSARARSLKTHTINVDELLVMRNVQNITKRGYILPQMLRIDRAYDRRRRSGMVERELKRRSHWLGFGDGLDVTAGEHLLE